MKKKITIYLLILAIICTFALPSLADKLEVNHDEVLISPMFTYIAMAEAKLFINSSGKATVETYVTGNSNVTSVLATIKVQQYKGGRWTTIKTWNESSNYRILNFNGSYHVSSGYEYRIVLL